MAMSSSTLCREDQHERCDGTYAWGARECGCLCHDLPPDVRGDLDAAADEEWMAEDEALRLDDDPATMDGGFDD